MENTVDDEINGTREESTTHSEDKHQRLMSKNKLNSKLLVDYPDLNRNNNNNNIYSNLDLPIHTEYHSSGLYMPMGPSSNHQQ